MVDEMRRLLAMTREGGREVLSGRARRHPGWSSDPHLRRGFLLALPLWIVGAPVALAIGVPAWFRHHNPVPFLAVGLPLSLLLNGLWLYLAARSRKRAGEA